MQKLCPIFFPALVSADLSLPESGEFRSTIRWTSGTPWLVTDSGKIRRPAVGQEDGKASMQAEISYGDASRLCRFSFLVAAEPGPEALLREDVDSVVIPYALYLGSPPCLPVCGKNGSAFRWHSSRGDVFSPDSKSFLRPIGHPVSVTLTLEATLDRFRQEKTFSLRFWPVCPTLPGPVFSSAAVRPQKKKTYPPRCGTKRQKRLQYRNSVPNRFLSPGFPGTALPCSQKTRNDAQIIFFFWIRTECYTISAGPTDRILWAHFLPAAGRSRRGFFADIPPDTFSLPGLCLRFHQRFRIPGKSRGNYR